MPLKHDAEYKQELQAAISITQNKSARPWIFGVPSALVLGGVAAALVMSGAGGAVVVSGTLVACTVWISWHLAFEARSLHLQLVTLISVVEWVGRKQLGEYEPPHAAGGDRE